MVSRATNEELPAAATLRPGQVLDSAVGDPGEYRVQLFGGE
jgi:hypothetical protein